MIAFLLASPLLSTVPGPIALTAPTAKTIVDDALGADEVKSIVDANLRWLRSHQDTSTGSYGSIELTATVLRALAESPRQYRFSDGPYVSKAVQWLVGQQRSDGAFATETDDTEEARGLTQASAAALSYFQTDTVQVARKRAADFLGSAEAIEPSAVDLEVSTLAKLLAARNDAGRWGTGEGDALLTARNCITLGAVYRSLRKAEGKAAPTAPRTARELPAFEPADRARSEKAIARGASFLLESAENGLWGFQGRPDPGITAMVTGALLCTPTPRSEELAQTLDGALDYLVSLQHEDGSIHAGQLANYVTSASILAFVRGGRPQDEPVIARAREFLRVLQADEGEGYVEGDAYYGGVGYGGDERPDLSNMQMALEALAASGLEEDDATFEKALVFLRRCQNRSETNDLVLERDGVTYASGEDGGSGYAPGDSKAGFIELADGRKVPRSYGSMSYALLKGYLFAGLDREDPRMVALWEWLQANYTLDLNPGFEAASDPTAAYQGLFYYFLTMARALDLYGAEEVVDGAGVHHPWRSELCGRLVAMQRADGSWLNENASRWYEGNPVLATAYALVTLRTALPNQR